MSKRDWAMFCKQMSLFLKVGVPLDEGLVLMLEYSDSDTFEHTIKLMQKEMKKSRRLDQVLEQVEGVPAYMIHMIRIGTLAGRLEEALEGLSQYYEKEEDLKENLRSAMTYPLLLSGMMLIVLIVLAVQVLPLFEEMMGGLGANVPYTAQLALNTGRTLGYVGIGVIVLLIMIGSWILVCIKKGQIPSYFRKLINRTEISQQIALMQLASSLTMLLKSGLSIEEALEETQDSVNHTVVKKRLEESMVILRKGRSIEKALKESQLFSPLAIRMLCIGIHTGCIEEVMEDVAKNYSKQVEERLLAFMNKVEPLIVAVLAVLIGGILLSVMLPLIGMMAALG